MSGLASLRELWAQLDVRVDQNQPSELLALRLIVLEKADDFCLRFENTSLGSAELQLAANYLRLLHRRCVFVAHRADFHASFSLFVSLLEELLHDPVRPLPVQLQRLGGIAQVRTMYHVSENLQLHSSENS